MYTVATLSPAPERAFKPRGRGAGRLELPDRGRGGRLRATGADLADNQVPPPDAAARGQGRVQLAGG